jgi:alpha/beta superfamily hydrolase
MAIEVNVAEEATGTPTALAVLLHPHPHFGGNRFHPFIEALFRRLPESGVTAIRFDFSSAELPAATAEVVAVTNEGSTRWPQLPVLLVGYSFGAGIAAGVDDERIAGWYLLAPPVVMLAETPIGPDPRPKRIVVPALDQFSPPDAVEHAVTRWAATTVTTVPNADHFLGAVAPFVDDAIEWIDRTTHPGPNPGPNPHHASLDS